ncbi:DUF4249 domain-containing protein [Maribellus comscasis]|nr:DUF4249 domain-containing protein [Maribellus comscasis]
MLILSVVACEEIYRPDLEEVDAFLVVEAILVSNQTYNNIYLYKTLGFNDDEKDYPSVTGALIYLVDENDNQIECLESAPGTYTLNHNLETGAAYHLIIEYDGEKYESGTQTVPESPVTDSVYAEYTTRIVTTGASSSTDKIEKENGIQIYADMNFNGGINHYRFYARKIIQYIDHYDTTIPPSPEPETNPIYRWNSYYPTGIFNIAGPAEYSTDKNIAKHSLEFFESNYNKYFPDTMLFGGWIYIIYQYGINEDTYEFYSDLNSQLDAEGKIFDPIYIQAEGNISCTSNDEKVVLGNFEISSFSESRFYLNYSKYRDSISALKNIPYFYNIPEDGYVKDIMPDFWETRSKRYPDE